MKQNYHFLESMAFPNGAQVRNRIVMAPMTEMMAFHDGSVSSAEVDYMVKRSKGVGLLITPVAYINPEGKGFEGQLGVDADDKIPHLAKLAYGIKSGGAKAILQIFSAGRMTNSNITRGLQPVAPSAVPSLRENAQMPRALTDEEIKALIQDFAEATRRAIEAGFDGVELHGANTYLLQQFFSPHSNRREDEWGGSLEKRISVPLAVIEATEAVRQEHNRPDFIIGYRISPEELEEPGITLDDSLYLVERLQKTDIDYIHLSLDAVWQTSIRDENDKRIITEAIKAVSPLKPVITVGGVKTPQEAEAVITKGIDLVALGRQLIIEPHWVEKVISGEEDSIRYTLHKADLETLGIEPPFAKLLNFMPRIDVIGDVKK